MAHDVPVFPPSLVHESIVKSLPGGDYTIRPLARDDYSKGYFECLHALTWTGNVSEARFQERFDWMRTKGEGWFYNIVVEHEGRIVGNGVLIAERKFIWNLAMCGHLEEISVLKAYQGKGLGKRVIEALTAVAKNVGCCKVILNCSPENEAFYAKCGYEKSGAEMSIKFEGFEQDKSPEST